MLIKPAYETDAVWDTIRTSQPLGLWWLGSHLKERGHEVRLLDETVRDGGLEKKVMFRRELVGDKITDSELEITYDDFQRQKMQDFSTMTSKEFVGKYSAFQGDKIIRNMVRTGNSIEDTVEEAIKMKPDFIGISIFASCNYPSAISLAQSVKEAVPTANIVMGGQHVTALTDEVLEKCFVDYVITGDSLRAMTQLVERGSLSQRLNGGVMNIGEFSLLDMDLMAENKYPTSPNHTYDTQGREWVDYMFSKGCYRSCDFCVAGERDQVISTTQLDRIDEQLQRFVDAGIKEIVVQDDAFLFKPERNLKEYLNLMKKHGLYWQDNGGIEFEGLTPPVVQMFLDYQKEGNGKISALYIPLNPRKGSNRESALQDMKERFGENFSHVKKLRDSGIYVYTSEILGYPGQSMESMEEDIKLHQELVREGYADKSITFVTSTLPGTKLYRKQHKNIVNKSDWAAYSNFVPQSRTDRVSSAKDIEKMIIKRNQRMNNVQTTYDWGSPFPTRIDVYNK